LRKKAKQKKLNQVKNCQKKIKSGKNSEEKNKSGKNSEETPSLQTEVEKMLEAYGKPDAGSKNISTLMVCYDSGGQPEFFDVIPALATNPIGYIMVLDLSKKLDEPIESEIVIDGETKKRKRGNMH